MGIPITGPSSLDLKFNFIDLYCSENYGKKALTSDSQKFKINKAYNYLFPQLIEQPMTYNSGNPAPGLGQVQTCNGVKPVNWIPNMH